MWYNSFNNSESSQLSQVNSTTPYQVFGSPGGVQLAPGYVIQQNFQQLSGSNVLIPQPHSQYQSWSNSTEPVNYSFAHGSYMWNSPVNEQTPFSAHPQHSVLNAELSCKFEGKSVVVTKIHNLRSENVTLDEEIEEQKRRNSLLMKRIADAKEQLNTIQQNAANLYNECQSTDKTSERFSKQLDQEKRKLSETMTKKRSDISEIKGDAELVTTLRAEKDRSVADIARLRDDVADADIDVDNLTIKFQYELGKMVLFPFWKLEEEIDKALLSCDLNSCAIDGREEHVVDIDGDHNGQEKSAPGSKASSAENSKENSNESSEENSEENSAENSTEDSRKSSNGSLKENTEESSRTDEKSVTSQITVIKINTPAEDNRSVDKSPTLSESASIRSSLPSAHEGGVETGCEFFEDLSFAQNNDAPKKPAKKIRKSSRFVRWLRRLCCIPKGNKDE